MQAKHKSALSSTGIQGGLLTLVAAVLGLVGTPRDLDHLLPLAGALLAGAGGLMALWGRLTATHQVVATEPGAWPTLQPQPDGETWITTQEFRHYSPTLGRTVVVPALTPTNFASTPRGLWWLWPPWGKYGVASVLHDELYTTHETTRAEADAVLYEVAVEYGTPVAVAWCMWAAVRAFGQGAWDAAMPAAREAQR